MQIKHTGLSGKARDLSIADAIDGTIDDAGSDDGAVERAQSRVAKAASIVGQLVQFLHENGNLRDEQVAEMLGYRYTVEE